MKNTFEAVNFFTPNRLCCCAACLHVLHNMTHQKFINCKVSLRMSRVQCSPYTNTFFRFIFFKYKIVIWFISASETAVEFQVGYAFYGLQFLDYKSFNLIWNFYESTSILQLNRVLRFVVSAHSLHSAFTPFQDINSRFIKGRLNSDFIEEIVKDKKPHWCIFIQDFCDNT